MSLSLLVIKGVYRFDTYAPSELGTTLTDMKLAGTLDFDLANAVEPQKLRYAKIRSMMLASFPDVIVPADPTQSLYYRFKSVSDPSMSIILSQHWIKPSSIQVLQATNISVSMVLSSVADIGAVNQLLSAAYPTIQSFQISSS